MDVTSPSEIRESDVDQRRILKTEKLSVIDTIAITATNLHRDKLVPTFGRLPRSFEDDNPHLLDYSFMEEHNEDKNLSLLVAIIKLIEVLY